MERTGDAGWPALEAGRGPTVVFLPGYPLHHAMWQPQLSALAGAHHLVALDLPGYGLARAEAVPETLAGFAEWTGRTLAAHLPGPVVVVGHSFGGYVALQLFRQHPELFRGLVLADTRATPDTPEAKEKRWATIRRLEDPGEVLDAEATAKALLAPATWTEGGAPVDTVRSIVRDAGSPAVRGTLQAIATRPDLTEVLARVRVPTLVVWGEEDHLIPPAETQAMVPRLTDGSGVGIPRAGHLPSLEAPALLNLALADFLDRLGP